MPTSIGAGGTTQSPLMRLEMEEVDSDRGWEGRKGKCHVLGSSPHGGRPSFASHHCPLQGKSCPVEDEGLAGRWHLLCSPKSFDERQASAEPGVRSRLLIL